MTDSTALEKGQQEWLDRHKHHKTTTDASDRIATLGKIADGLGLLPMTWNHPIGQPKPPKVADSLPGLTVASSTDVEGTATSAESDMDSIPASDQAWRDK